MSSASDIRFSALWIFKGTSKIYGEGFPLIDVHNYFFKKGHMCYFIWAVTLDLQIIIQGLKCTIWSSRYVTVLQYSSTARALD